MNISSMIDHTILKADATSEMVKTLCEEAKEYKFAAVCVNPTHIEYCKELLKDSDVKVATVIGFPLGANTKETKAFETVDAINKGADEVDMVINIGAKNEYDGLYNYKSSPTQSLNPGANQNDAELTTTGAYTVSTNLVNTYSNITRYAIDPVTNKVTVTDSGNIGDATTDPSSNWDPVNKVLYVKWNTSNRQFEETYTRIGDRD